MTGPGPDRLPSRARKDVEKYLLPGETAVVVTRRHWAVLIEPTAKFLPVLLAGGWLLLLDPDNRFTSAAGLLLVVVSLSYYGLRLAEWWMRHFIVSKRRVLLTSGVIVRTVTLLPLRRITDLTWQETLLGQLLGYGTFRFESAGKDQALRHLTFMPDAQRRYRQVSELLFGSDYGAAASGDDEGNDDRDVRSPDGPSPVAPAGGRRDTEPIPGSPPSRP
jgi:membrane protein YdbS with pleckstrin-like domain